MDQFLVDTSVWIACLRSGDFAASGLPALTQLWLSAVVIEELYAGARAADREVVENLEKSFAVLDRILVPDQEDWRNTGLTLSRLAQRYGYEQIGRGRLTNDALIAMSAARRDLVVLTLNARDFTRLAEVHPFRWRTPATAQ